MKNQENNEINKKVKASEKNFFEGKYFQLENNLADAEKMYQKSIDSTNEDNVFYHLSKGNIYVIHEKIEDALTEFIIANSISPDNIEAHIGLGNVYRKLTGKLRAFGMLDKAESFLSQSISSLQRAVELNENCIDGYIGLTLGFLMMREDSIHQAKKNAEKVLEIDSNNYYGLINMAKILRGENKNDLAKELLNKAIGLKPNIFGAYIQLGARKEKNMQPLEPRPIEALKYLEKANELSPNSSYILNEIAKTYIEWQQTEKAIEYFDKIVNLKGETVNYGVYANRGNALRSCNKFKEAEKDLRKCLSIREDFVFALIAMRNLTKELKRHEEALAYAHKVCELQSNHKNNEEKRKIEELFVKDKTESISITNYYKKQRLDFKNKKTIDDLQRAFGLLSTNYDAKGMLGMYYSYKKDFKNAHKFLQNAIDINPQATFYRGYLASVLESLGETKLAKKEYEIVLKKDPQNQYAQNGLKKINQKLQGQKKKEVLNVSKGPQIKFLNSKTGREEIHSVELIRNFLNDRMNDWKLPIREIIPNIGKEPVFIIAKTGVGKTVTVPTKVWLELCDKLVAGGEDFKKSFPQVYVVEPRIPICTMTMIEMNDGYQNYLAHQMIKHESFRKYLKNNGIKDVDSKEMKTVNNIVKLAFEFVKLGNAPYNPRHFNLYGCITSATGKINADAPILFVTTGIMESLTFEGSKLDPKYNRIIIDEAHVTIEQNPAIELGIALARKQGVNIDYMSATVDKATLAEDLDVRIEYAGTQRFPIYLTNLGGTVEEHLLDVLENFLINPNPERFPNPDDFQDEKIKNGMHMIRKHLLSQEDFVEDGKTYVGLKKRAQGLLIIVNSHNSENADTKKFADMIIKADFQSQTKVHTLRLASAVVRNPQQKLAFDRMIQKIEKEKGRYVIVATNVVEMGLTFSSLDYVITMDSEFDNEFMDGSQLIKKVGLGVNALYQRIGRCGRVRPGIAFIAKDFGASYTEKNDQELAEGLQEAPVRYPLAKGNFQKLALYSFRENIAGAHLQDTIRDLKLPSKIHESSELWERFLSERERLIQIGIASGDSLTNAGKKSLSFIGLDDMYFSRLLSESIERYGLESNITLFFVLLAASSEIPFGSMILRDFVLENPIMLSSYEIINNDVLNADIELVKKCIVDNLGNTEAIYNALSQANVGNVVANKICHLLKEGYLLKAHTKEEGDNVDEFVDENIEEDIVDEEISEDIKTNKEKQKLFFESIQQKNTDVLSFEKTLIPLYGTSELINIWRLFHYFFNKYFAQLRTNKYSDIESVAFKKKMELDLSKMQISFTALNGLNSRFFDLCKHVKIKLPKIETNHASDIELTAEDKEILLESCIRELLHERVGSNDDYDICIQLYKLMQKSSKPDYKEISQKLHQKEINVTPDDVKKWWFLIIKESKIRMQKYVDMIVEKRELLPILTSQEEHKILELLYEYGYHHQLVLNKNNYGGYTTTYTDKQGQSFEVYFDANNSPLQVGCNSKDTIKIYAKLAPKLEKVDEKKDDPDYSSSENNSQEEKIVYKISHITLIAK